MDKIKYFINKNKKAIIITLSSTAILGGLIFININSNKKDNSTQIIDNTANNISINKDNPALITDKNNTLNLLKGTIIGTQIPEDVLYNFLTNFIQENNIEGIKDLFISINEQGITLKAKYSLLNFINIPAEFVLIPSHKDSSLILTLDKVKIMSFKIKVDKIIEKWINANEEIQSIATYNNGAITIDISNLKPIQVEEISLLEGKINISCKIN